MAQAKQWQPNGLSSSSSSESEDRDAEEESSGESVDVTKKPAAPAPNGNKAMIVGGRAGGAAKPAAAVDQPAKRPRAVVEEDKAVAEPEGKRKKGAIAEKQVPEEVEHKKRKGGKAENGGDKKAPPPPAKLPTKKERKAAEKAEKEAEKDKEKEKEKVKENPKVVDKDVTAVSEKKTGKSKKQAREVEAVKAESPRSTPPQKNVTGETPAKKQNNSHWSFEDEMLLSSEILAHMKPGQKVTGSRGDTFFLQLTKDLEGKLDGPWGKEQVSDKVRRMKQRAQTLEKSLQDKNSVHRFKNEKEEKLYNGYWKKIWGSTPEPPPPTPEKAPVAVNESEDESEEDEDEVVAGEVQDAKSGMSVESEASSQDSKGKKDEQEEEEEEEEEEETKTEGENVEDDSQSSLPTQGDIQTAQNGAVPDSLARVVEKEKTRAISENQTARKGEDGKGVASTVRGPDDMDVDQERTTEAHHGHASSKQPEASDSRVLALLAGLESQVSSLKQDQEKTLSLLEDMKVHQNLQNALIEELAARVPGVSMPMFSPIPGLLGRSAIPANGLHGRDGVEHLKLQQQWRELDMDELGCVARRCQLLQQQHKLHEEELQLLRSKVQS